MKRSKILAIGLGIIAFTIIPVYFEVSAGEIEQATNVINETEIDESNEISEEITLIEKIDLIKEAFGEEIIETTIETTTDTLQMQENTTDNREVIKPAFGFTENNKNSVILISAMFLILALVLIYTIFVIKRINLNTDEE